MRVGSLGSPPDATPRDAREVMRRLEAEGYRPTLVGGLAIELAGFGGTKDVDLLVPEAEYGGAEYLKGAGIEVLSTTVPSLAVT